MPGILDKFIEEVKKIYGPNLESIVLFGSRASGEDTEKHSDYNLLLVVKDINPRDLKSLNRITRFWIRKGNPIPVIFTKKRLENSADVFPMEFYDMKDHHKVLYGEDPLRSIVIENKNLRHECESELKGKLLKLQQGYMASRNDADVRNLLIGSISTFLIIFRHMVRLLGKMPPLKRLDALNVLAGTIDLNPSAIVTVFDMKKGDREALKKDPDALMEEFLKEIEKVVEAVDNLQEAGL